MLNNLAYCDIVSSTVHVHACRYATVDIFCMA